MGMGGTRYPYPYPTPEFSRVPTSEYSLDYSNKMDDQEYLKKVQSKLANKHVDDAFVKMKNRNYYIIHNNL